jgi:hypothetical protein
VFSCLDKREAGSIQRVKSSVFLFKKEYCLCFFSCFVFLVCTWFVNDSLAKMAAGVC